jgi:hypothetical protein
MQGGLTDVSPRIGLHSVLFLTEHFGAEPVVLRGQAGLALRDAPCLDADEHADGDGNGQDEEADAQEREAPHGGGRGVCQSSRALGTSRAS